MEVQSNSGKSVGIIFIIVASLLMTHGIPITQVAAASDFYSEDFTTTTYLDSENTNATGWGDGSLSLPNKEPTAKIDRTSAFFF